MLLKRCCNVVNVKNVVSVLSVVSVVIVVTVVKVAKVVKVVNVVHAPQFFQGRDTVQSGKYVCFGTHCQEGLKLPTAQKK